MDKEKIKRIRLLCILSGVLVILLALGIFIWSKVDSILHNGKELFVTTPKPTSVEVVNDSPAPTGLSATLPPLTATPEPTATPDPYEELLKQADTSMMHNIVNIMFIGVDYEEARVQDSWKGKSGNAFHSDTMIVCAINFDENKVDLISLPRDTYANIPGVKGIYKLNASLNCGTDGVYYGMDCPNGEGFLKVCEAAEWMLGGLEVDYYYAVTMESVKELIDAVGGVEYDLEGDFDNGGRHYKKGLQHFDGQACLDYMRVRKGGHGNLATGDGNRVIRQKNILKALFNSVKEKNMILMLPKLLSTFKGALYTNCSWEQTAALAAFAYKLNSEDIGMHAMSGSTHTLFHWNFAFPDQKNRVEVIKQVYGVDVPQNSQYSYAYARYTWGSMLMEKYVKNCDGLIKHIDKALKEDDLLPEAPPSESPEPTAEPTEKPEEPAVTDTPAPTQAAETQEPAPEAALPGTWRLSSVYREEKLRQYTKEDRDLVVTFKNNYKDLQRLLESTENEAKKAAKNKKNSLGSYVADLMVMMEEVQKEAIELSIIFGYDKVKNFTVFVSPLGTYTSSPWALDYWENSKMNEINVNFN